jgi:hypothetical protein
LASFNIAKSYRSRADSGKLSNLNTGQDSGMTTEKDAAV